MTVTLRYEDGTIRIVGEVPAISFVERDDRSQTSRAPGYRYADLRDALDERDVAYEDRVLDFSRFDGDQGLHLDDDTRSGDRVLPAPLDLSTTYDLRDYQREALDAWNDAGRWGVIELPTGSGKTVVAIGAIAALATPTLVVVPTIDLLEQWHEELSSEFDVAVGRLGGGEQRVEPLTVATYDSAYLRADDVGDAFGVVVFDEAHHLGGEGYRDVARLLAAPARMGLTATFERPDGAHEVISDLIGGRVYALDAEDLAGEHLASYDIKRIEVSLTPDERADYEQAQETFVDYLRGSNLSIQSGADYQKLVLRSGTDPRAREALLAKERAREITLTAENKIRELASVLDRHRDDRVIVFTARTDFVYRLSERFLLSAITSETGASERRRVLRRFRDGTYSRIVTANVLDEGIDVPDANVAVVLSGSGSEREFTQRLGRVLRPTPDGRRALLYEVVCAETTEENVADRRR